MPGFVPGIHVFPAASKDADGRDEPGHDDAEGEVEPNFDAVASRVELVCASG
jgi:hypothetical protein